MAELRLGILGGTFNPIHVGHLLFAESLRETLALDRVLLVPAGTPPHKTADDLAPALDRFAMVALAVAGHPGFAVSAVELERPGPSYSVDTLDQLAADWPAARLFFLMGSDTFLDLPTWHAPERLGARATLVLGHRAGSPFDAGGAAAAAVLARLGLGRDRWRPVPPTPPARLAAGDVALVEACSLPVSARDVRAHRRAGRSVRYLVPLPVADYIVQRRLYAEPA
jgi:nicotinate-nucleotide adenylyltransferase